MKVTNAAAGRRGNLRPGINPVKAGFVKNLGVLTDNNFLGEVDFRGKAKDGIDKSGGIQLLGIAAQRV